MTLKAIAKSTGIGWFNIVTALFMFAFLLYIIGNGSSAVYKRLLFGSPGGGTNPGVVSIGPQGSSMTADGTISQG